MQSHYLLNIARIRRNADGSAVTAFYDGKHNPTYEHFAAVKLPQMKAQEKQAIAAALDIAKRFPSSEGFKLELTYWEGRGQNVAFLDC